MDKKGVELSVNVIIVAAIALAVLVVLFAIFTGRIALFSKGIEEATTCKQACSAAGYKEGFSTPETSTVCSDGNPPLPGYSIIEGGVRKKCCCR